MYGKPLFLPGYFLLGNYLIFLTITLSSFELPPWLAYNKTVASTHPTPQETPNVLDI